jgi:predicted TPR repeat methyltransferase
VASVAEKHNLNLVHYEPLDGFRQEQGKAVRGHLFVLRKGRAIRDEL